MQNCSKLWNKSVNQLMGGSVEMKIFDSVNKREKKKKKKREREDKAHRVIFKIDDPNV